MQRDADTSISNNEKAFITEALVVDCRLDGRSLYDYRKLKFEFSLDDSSVVLSLGTTRVSAVISAALEAPYPDRPSEGSVRFNVECGPMASPAFEPGRPGPLAIQLARLVERTLKQSGAVDTEALCVIAGRKVWALRCDVHVLDHGGNLIDACVLAALAAFSVFRRPDVSVGGESGTEVIVHPKEQREPLPLTIHHTPVAVTWALYQGPDGGVLCAVDPSLREEAAQAGSTTFMVNTGKEVCGTHKAEGLGITAAETMRLVRLSCGHAEVLVGAMKQALQAHEVARVAARVRRTQGMGAAGLPAPSRHVTVSTTAHAALAAGGQQPAGDAAANVPAGDGGVDGMDITSSSSASESEESETSDSGSDEEMDAPGKEGGAAAAAPVWDDGQGKVPRMSGPLLASTSGSKGTPNQPSPSHIKQEAAPSTGSSKGASRPASSTQAGSTPVATKKDMRTAAVKAEPAASAAKLDDNLEAIAALIAGKTPGSLSGDAADDGLDLTAAIKTQNLKKTKKKLHGKASS